ncbi:MAG: hypothetical protein CTY29_12785 [Methylobacter sp.]|nr:MAG: hypothetical protein CTY29_12785 [Methylobacter sp.]
MKMIKIFLGIVMLAAGGQNAAAAPITLTPPNALVIDGVNVNQGIFTLLSTLTLDVFASIEQGEPVFQNLIDEPVSVPVQIGSGTEHFLFDGPEQFLPLNFFSFSFQVLDPVPASPSVVTAVVISALPELTLSLPSESDFPLSFQIIDSTGNLTIVSAFNFSLTPDPLAVENIDILGDGSLFVTLTQENLEFRDFSGNLLVPSFQSHGRVGGFALPPSSVPLPTASWMLLSGILGWLYQKRK